MRVTEKAGRQQGLVNAECRARQMPKEAACSRSFSYTAATSGMAPGRGEPWVNNEECHYMMQESRLHEPLPSRQHLM